jgi:hypothetical protein
MNKTFLGPKNNPVEGKAGAIRAAGPFAERRAATVRGKRSGIPRAYRKNVAPNARSRCAALLTRHFESHPGKACKVGTRDTSAVSMQLKKGERTSRSFPRVVLGSCREARALEQLTFWWSIRTWESVGGTPTGRMRDACATRRDRSGLEKAHSIIFFAQVKKIEHRSRSRLHRKSYQVVGSVQEFPIRL